MGSFRDSLKLQDIVFFSKGSVSAQGPPNFLSNAYREIFLGGLKRPERDDDQSPLSSDEVKNGVDIAPLHLCFHGVVLYYLSIQIIIIIIIIIIIFFTAIGFAPGASSPTLVQKKS
jgi:hypothetical protein